MSSYRHRKQLRRTSRINIMVLLMSLLLLNGHCATAYASANAIPMPEHHAISDTAGMAVIDHHSQPDADCVEMHEADPAPSLVTSSVNQLKDKQDDIKPLLAMMSSLPEPRAGPVSNSSASCSAEFQTTPLYYSLCVLRL